MTELVEIFVGEVPDKVHRIVEFEQVQNWPELKRVVHQLKGSAGGYGFDVLTPTCVELEYLLQEKPESLEVIQLTQLLVNQLLQLRSH
jgi:HPt (histidine-containing phosphotransfer) domain-containing protein